MAIEQLQAVGNLLGVLLGGLITWLVSRHYYKKAGDELYLASENLRQEALEINRLTNIVLRGLHNAGIFEVTWQDGKPIGLVLKLKAKSEVKTSTSDVNLTVD
jgi:hypothetical protein